MRLAGKTALVTGATSNIGRAIAVALAAAGAHVVVAGRNKERGDEVVAQIRTAGGRAVGTPDAIGHAAVYLASDEAAFVHGTTLDVDGGRIGAAVIAG